MRTNWRAFNMLTFNASPLETGGEIVPQIWAKIAKLVSILDVPVGNMDDILSQIWAKTGKPPRSIS